jgi:hypothetical protein
MDDDGRPAGAATAELAHLNEQPAEFARGPCAAAELASLQVAASASAHGAGVWNLEASHNQTMDLIKSLNYSTFLHGKSLLNP